MVMITIDPNRLKQVREGRRLTQAALANKARVDKQTIYRFEHEKKPRRLSIVERIAKVLAVEIAVLTAEMPVPDDESSEEIGDHGYQINVRIDGQIRNAFAMASARYKVPIRRIVELAPLLFVIVAERSLERRRTKLIELKSVLQAASDQWQQVPHFPAAVGNLDDHREIIEAEEKSIAARDLYAAYEFTNILQERDDLPYSDDLKRENPFAVYVRELADDCDDIVVDSLGLYSDEIDYSVCWSDIMYFADGDQRLALAVHLGILQVHEVLRELLSEETDYLPRGSEWSPAGVERRIRRMHEMLDQSQATKFLDRCLENPGWLQKLGVRPSPPMALLLEMTKGDEALAQKLSAALASQHFDADEWSWLCLVTQRHLVTNVDDYIRRKLEPDIAAQSGVAGTSEDAP